MDEGAAGVNFRNMLVESEEMNVINYFYFYNGDGVYLVILKKDIYET